MHIGWELRSSLVGDTILGVQSEPACNYIHFPHRCCFVVARTLFDLNIKDVSQCVMPGVKKSNDVELQLHESDATDQTEVSSVTNSQLCVYAY